MADFQDAFISYGRADSKDFAQRLCQQLSQRGLTVWFDFNDIPLGVKYQDQIDAGIEQAHNVVFVISPHAVNSPYCALELALALKYHKRIIPVLHVERIDYDTWQARHPTGTLADWQQYQAEGRHDHFQNMPAALRQINWVYAREGIDCFDTAIAQLLAILSHEQAYVQQHTALLLQALIWQRQHRQSLYLLIGEERLQAEAWLKQRPADLDCTPTDLHCEFISESRKNADNLMSDVFLAYADEDQAAAAQIGNSLRREGFTVWTRTTDLQAGMPLQLLLERGIEEADNVVYMLSAAALQSPWCQHSLAYALALHKRVIPVRAGAIAPAQLPPTLQGLQQIDLTDNLSNTDYRRDESELLRILRQEAAYHNDHKRLLAKALKWQQQQQHPALLLRGYNLRYAESWLQVAQKRSSYPALPLQAAFIEASLQQPPGGVLDVFICYSRADSGFARQLNEALQLHGKRTWFDQESIAAGTADFQQEIYRGIESADTVLFILSPRSVSSPYCAAEVEHAVGLNKRLVTLLHQPVEPSQLHPELAKIQWLDFRPRDRDFSAALVELLRLLDKDVEHLHRHTQLLLRALEWQEKGSNESLLLRGDELSRAEQWLAAAATKQPPPSPLHSQYLSTSRTVETAQHQATRILQAAAAKGRQRALVGAGAAAVGLAVAGLSGVAAYRANTRLQIANLSVAVAASSEQLAAGNTFAGLLQALETGQQLNTLSPSSAAYRSLQPRVMGALQAAVSSIREKNTLRGHRDAIWSIRFSPDGRLLASASVDDTVKIWEVATGRELHSLSDHQARVYGVSFSPDGKTLASVGDDRVIRLWDVASGRPLQQLTGHAKSIYSVDFSPDGQTLASASNDKTVRLWQVATGKSLRILTGHQETIEAVRFSPDGQTLASASNDGTLRLWQAATGAPLHVLRGHQGPVYGLSFSRDGKTLISAGDDRTIRQWQVATGRPGRTLQGHQAQVYSVSVSHDGRLLASASDDNTIKLWDLSTGRELLSLGGHLVSVNSVSFSPIDQTLASASYDKTIKLWQMPSNAELGVAQSGAAQASTAQASAAKLNGLSFSPDGKTLAAASQDATVQLWPVGESQPARLLKGHQNGVNSVRFSPNGQILASASQDATIRLWDSRSGRPLRRLSDHQEAVFDISFSPDGQLLASASADESVRLWNVQTGQALRQFRDHAGRVTNVRFSPDGQLLASTGDDRTVRLRQVDTGRLLRTLPAHQSTVWGLSFSPDGQTLASSSFDNEIKLWQVATGLNLKTLQGHQGSVISVEFSPDGQTLISASDDNSIKLWDVATGQALHTLQGHQDAVSSALFSPDGKTIASASSDGSLRFWLWDFEQLMAAGCRWIESYLVTHERDRARCQSYLPAATAPRQSAPRRPAGR